jgi:hypothetical protein
MITFECAWCDGEMVLESLDAESVDCPDCAISVEIAPDAPTLPIALVAA